MEVETSCFVAVNQQMGQEKERKEFMILSEKFMVTTGFFEVAHWQSSERQGGRHYNAFRRVGQKGSKI